MVRRKAYDLVIVLALFGVAGALTFVFNLNPAVSWLAYYTPGTLFLVLRKPRKDIKKLIFGAAIAGLLVGGAIDLLASYNNIWLLEQMLFSATILGELPIDDLVWWFFSMLFVFSYYEHFVSANKKPTWRASKRLFIFSAVAVGLLLIIALGVFLESEVLLFDYFYVKMGIVLVAPLVFVLVSNSQALCRFFLWSIPFFFMNLLLELVGVHLGQWSFPDDYIGMVSLFGISFPAEELIFWMILGTPVMFAWYAGFLDFGKDTDRA